MAPIASEFILIFLIDFIKIIIYYVVKLEKSFYSFNYVTFKEKIMNKSKDIFK